ncbi:MAG TPA: hypothetical protein VGK47_08180 [Nitrososphaeraceae archaeon]
MFNNVRAANFDFEKGVLAIVYGTDTEPAQTAYVTYAGVTTFTATAAAAGTAITLS